MKGRHFLPWWLPLFFDVDGRGCFLSWQLFQRNLQCSSWVECCFRRCSSVLLLLFFWCLSPSGCSHSERTKDSRGSSIPGGSCLPFRDTEVKQNPNPCTPLQVTDRGVSSVTVNMRNAGQCKQRPQTMCSSLNTASSDREIQLFIKICGFMSELVVSWCWNAHGAALTCSWLWNVSGTSYKIPTFVYPLHIPILPAAMLSYDFVQSWVLPYEVTCQCLRGD